MKKYKFSVLMSIYKKENPMHFSDAMDSVFNQTLLPNEVILIEDGKLPDELEKVVVKYEKKYSILRVIRFEKSRGLGPALNDGIKECKYGFIARVDTDDICKPNRFEVQMKYLTDNPNVDVVGSNMTEYDENMINVTSIKKVPEKHDDIKKYLKKRNPMNHPTVIYKKNKVLEVRSYEDYPYFEDYYLWAKMIKNGCVFYNIQDELYNFRAGLSMIQRRGGVKYIKSIYKFERGLLDLEIIGKGIFMTNLIKRVLISLVPNFFRKILYERFLRKKSD